MDEGNLSISFAVKGNDLFLVFVSFLELTSKRLPWDLRVCHTAINNLSECHRKELSPGTGTLIPTQICP